MSVRADSRIGTELAGYQIERLLGRGGMGVVYLAHDSRLDRPVALKLLAPSLADDTEFRSRFLRESKLAASLDHQNVIPIYEAGNAEGTLFIAMRYVEGTDLRELLHQEDPLPAKRTIQLLAQVASALDVAHEHGLVHRDVKPGNILVAPDEHVYLGDFGLTRRAEDPDAGPAAGNSLGTVDYVAPEQIEGDPVDGRADVYSLGCVLYECLTGTPPFSSSSPMSVLWEHVQAEPPTVQATDTSLPDAIDPVIAHALAKHAEDRQPTCRELIDDAREALGLTRAPRRRLLFTLAALAAAAIAAAITIPLTLNQADTGSPTAKPPDTKPTLAINRDSVQHIDPATSMLVGTTQLGGHITQIAIGEGGVWVADPIPGPGGPSSATVFRLAPRTGEITGRVPGGTASNLDVGLGSVWVVDNGFYDGTLRAIDPSTLAARGVPLNLKSQSSSGGGPMAAGESVWLVATTSLQGTALRVHDAFVWALGGSCDAGPCFVKTAFEPIYVRAIAADNGTLWLSGYVDVNLHAGKLERVNEATYRYEGSTRLDFLPVGGLAAADGAVWIADPVGGKLVRIDAATRKIVARIPVGHGPAGVAVGAGGVWVTNYDDGTVSRIDPETNTVVGTIEVGPHPDHIAAGEDGVWVAVHAL